MLAAINQSGRLKEMDKVRGWVRARPDVWVIGALAAGLVVGGILGGVIGNAGMGDLEAEREELQTALAVAEGKARSAEHRQEEVADRLASEKKAILDKARRQAAEIVGKSQLEAEELEAVEGEIASAEGELANVESSLEGAEQEKSLSSFAGGIMKAEVDYTVGATYEAAGGSGCYWAMLNSANTNDISTNEITTHAVQQIVTIETPYFTSEGCGAWKRIE
jgi:hypothetical protein